MYHEKPPVDRKTLLLRLLAFLAAAVLVFGLLSALSGHIEKDLTEKGARVLKDTILQSAVQCYAVEGSYPPVWNIWKKTTACRSTINAILSPMTSLHPI